MRSLISICTLALLIVSSSISSNPINRKSAQTQATAAIKAQELGDWDAARKNWAKAVKNAELGKLDDKTLAVFYYEYGRALGVTCFFSEAESYLLKSKKLDEETTGEDYLSLSELARLNLDQNNYKQAKDYFETLFPKLDKVNASKEAPIAYADLLEEFHVVLFELGMRAKAKEVLRRANVLRSKYPGYRSITERTPYGSICTNPDGQKSEMNRKTEEKQGYKKVPYPAPRNCMWLRDSKTNLWQLDC